MQTRVKVSLNNGWQYVCGKATRPWLAESPDSTAVDLPHCWNADDAFKDGVEYYRGWGSYRRSFRLEEPAASTGSFRWLLVSEGFYGTGDVWLNGRCLGKVDGQYLGFSFDVTESVRGDGKNQLGIRLTNRCPTYVLPGIKMPDFLLYGGMSGRLWLERVPAVRMDERSVHVSTEGAQVTIDCKLEGEVSDRHALTWRILDDEGYSVGGDGQPYPGNMTLSVEEPRPWDIDSPYLYTAEGTLTCRDEVVDRITVRFGFRSAEFRPGEGFFLNSRRVPLRGCNRHESMPGFGRALPLPQHRRDAELIKAMGLNFVRLSHYPQHPEFLDACDELGILVYAEVASWKSVRGGRWLSRACRQMRDMVVRDRNHPSVILWGMGNEGRHRKAFQELYAICKELDPERAVTYAENHLYRARRKGAIGLPDVWGLNYEFDALEEGRDASRLRCVVVSECSNYPHTERGNAEAEETQLETIKADLARIQDLQYVAGFALWCFNDYATLRKQRYKRYSGLVDAQRVPKASARWLASEFGGNLPQDEPLVAGEIETED